MEKHTVVWKQRGRKIVASTQQLDALLDRLHAEFEDSEPILAEVGGPGGSLMIALGSNWSVLSFVALSGDPPYYVSRGGSAPFELFDVYFCAHHSQFPGSQLIPVATARQVMREFVASATLPQTIDWEEV